MFLKREQVRFIIDYLHSKKGLFNKNPYFIHVSKYYENDTKNFFYVQSITQHF